MMNERAGLTLRTIVVAVLVLIVLVLLIVMSTDALQGFWQGTNKCDSRGDAYRCESSDAGCDNKYRSYPPGDAACGEGKMCCVEEDAIEEEVLT